MTLKSKISSITTIETHPFWPYSYILWKAVYRNTWYMCIILVANIIGALATQYIRPFIWISPLSIRVADVSSQFLRHSYIIRSFWLRAFWRHFLATKSYFPCTKKWTRTRVLRSIISNLKYSYQPENTKKKFRVMDTLISA